MIDNMSIWLHIGGKIVPGQNDTFAPVIPPVPGQFSRCPCGVGAYGLKTETSRPTTSLVLGPRCRPHW